MLEYLPGTEYTIDCFSDRDRGLHVCWAAGNAIASATGLRW